MPLKVPHGSNPPAHSAYWPSPCANDCIEHIDTHISSSAMIACMGYYPPGILWPEAYSIYWWPAMRWQWSLAGPRCPCVCLIEHRPHAPHQLVRFFRLMYIHLIAFALVRRRVPSVRPFSVREVVTSTPMAQQCWAANFGANSGKCKAAVRVGLELRVMATS